ncbi:MAG: nucleoside recognition domain-containing protein [Bacteroidales bacterium]|nr:nucleoside recognition domain-containing protein [Bacteroidales bacterium]
MSPFNHKPEYGDDYTGIPTQEMTPQTEKAHKSPNPARFFYPAKLRQLPRLHLRRHTSRATVEALVFLAILVVFFGYLTRGFIPDAELPEGVSPTLAGLQNMLNTLMHTSYDLLITVVFFIMGITVLMGALSKLCTEFGVVNILEKMLRPLMKPLFNLPGIAALGAVVTFLSDNPAIIALSEDKRFASYFKTYQMVSLTNFGTAFGMGLVVVAFMIGQGYFTAPIVGLFGACVGCLISTRLMQKFTLKAYPEYDCEISKMRNLEEKSEKVVVSEDRQESIFMRFLNAILDGGKTGVGLGMAIIPGVLIISTVVMVLTFDTPASELDGSAYQGVGLLPWLADKIGFVFEWMWGFTNTQLIAFPITALGAVGAAIGLVPEFKAQGILDANAVAVFTAIGMCWSGYLSTHAAMLDSMGFRKLISKAIKAHTIAGICAGITAHWAWVLVEKLFF